MRKFSFTDTRWTQPGVELDALGAACVPGPPVLLVGMPDEIRDFRKEFENELD